MDDHIPETELSLFAFNPNAFSAERRVYIERHASNCTECGGNLDFYLAGEEDLADRAVWEPIVGSPKADAMRAFANHVAAEDEEADELLKNYIDKPGKAAWLDIVKQREFHTGGVVRRLNALAHSIVADNPLTALTFADKAVAVAEILPDDAYPNNAIYELRGTAWKERANALLRLAQLDEALQSLRRAERAYGHLMSTGRGLASVELVRAAVYYQRGELQKADFHAERAEHGYAHLGLQRHQMKAVQQRGQIKYEAAEYEAAAAIFERVIEYGEEIGDAAWMARGSYCRGACQLERGEIAEAAMLFNKALVIFREVGPASERTSTEWGLARVVLYGGNAGEAARRLRGVIVAFEGLGMVSDAALAGVDMCEALLVLERYADIAKVASHSFRVLKKAGILTGALTALANIKEAAAKRRLRRSGLQSVRKYLLRVEREPELVFIPPPEILD